MKGLVRLLANAFRELLDGAKQRHGKKRLLPERPAERQAA